MNKKFFTRKILYIFLVLSILGVFNYLVDAQQQIRYNKNYVLGEQRIINNGIARNYNYDTVVIGSSTSENSLKKDIDDIFNTNSVNLSLSGSTALEHRNLLNIITKRNNVKRVIYGLDFFNYNRLGTRVEIIDYGKSKNQILKYLLNVSTLKINLKVLINEILKKNKKNWIYTWSFWSNRANFSEKNTLDFDKNTESGAQNLGIIREAKQGYNIEIMKNNFDALLEIIKKTPHIEYRVYFTPYSILYWCILDKYDSLNAVIEFKKYVYYKSKRYPNIFLYDFQDRHVIIENLDNYKDAVHFKGEINKEIIKEIYKENSNNKNLDFELDIRKLIEKNRMLYKRLPNI